MCSFRTLSITLLLNKANIFGSRKVGLLLKRAQGSSDPTKLVVFVANFTYGSSFINRLPHLEGEEVFGSAKRFVNYPPSVNEDSHQPNRVNFSHP
jgi:hypothetical protein